MVVRLEDALHGATKAYVEAPAGFGKTHLILNTISEHPESKQLVLTHAIAGVAALRSRLEQSKIDSGGVSINTIAGWTQRYVRSYPELAGVKLADLDAMNVGAYWSTINIAFTKLLDNSNVLDIIRANYDGVYVDEYQDCSIAQHATILKLADSLPVRILGDPLQGIFDFNNDMVPWGDVEASFAHIATLDTPHRWINASNEAYGAWLLDVRSRLLAGENIDLNSAPPCVEVVMLSGDDVEDKKQYLKEARKSLPMDRHRMIIGDKQNAISKNLIKSLSHPRYILIESLDSKDVAEIKSYAEAMDRLGKDVDLTFYDVLRKCFTGLSPLSGPVTKIKVDPNYRPQKPIFQAFASLHKQFEPELAQRILKAVEKATGVSCHRRQLISILDIALSGLIAGDYADFATAADSAVESIRQRGRRLPRYSVGSTLLVKGLQVDEVLLMNANQLSTRDLYVALTRPTRKIVIFTNNLVLSPR